MTDFTALGLPADLPELADPSPSAPMVSEPLDLNFTPRQKAAIIVRALVGNGKRIALDELPLDLQTSLAHTLAELGGISHAAERQVIQEFVEALESGTQYAKGLANALSLLEGSISMEVQQELAKGQSESPRIDPWPRLADYPAEKLADLLQAEGAEVIAVCLSKLPGDLAAKVLSHLPGPQARRAAYTVSQISEATPNAIRTIGRSLLSQLTSEPPKAFDDDPAAMVGSILLSAKSATRDDIMEGLTEENEEFAERVREELFVFADIATRIVETDIPKILRGVDQAVLQNALKYSFDQDEGDARSAEFILNNMSKRMAETLREDITGMQDIDPETGEAAQGGVVQSIRTMETNGEISIKTRPKQNAG